MKLLKPVINKRSFEPIRPILESWFSVLKNYTERAEDSPFWYRERTQIGFLAIAAWLNGWAVLEEWRTEKGLKDKKSNGRNDLWIGNKKHDWYIEAKHTWCEIHKGEKKILKKLNKALDDAMLSANNLQCESSKKVAAVFVSPTWKGESKLDFEKAWKEWIYVCQEKMKADVVAVISSEFDECRKGKHDQLFVGSTLFLFGIK